MKRLFLPAIIAMVAFAVTACTDYDNDYSEKELEFQKNFEELYGTIDSNQDWNLATRGFVNVTLSKPSNVKVYSKLGKKYGIIGDFVNVNGSQKLEFDIMKGVSQIMVTDGKNAHFTRVGGSVNMLSSGTRSGHYGTYDPDEDPLNPNGNELSVKETEMYKVFHESEIKEWQTILPEKDFNLDKVTKDFTFVSTGKFYMYPIYWQSSSTNEIGMYIYVDGPGDGVVEISRLDGTTKYIKKAPIYTIKSGDELQYGKWTLTYAPSVASNPLNDVDANPAVLLAGREYRNFTPATWNEDKTQMKTVATWDEVVWEPVGAQDPSSTPFEWSEDVEFERSRAIEIDVPVGTKFGFYLDHSNGTDEFYSEAANNSDFDYANHAVSKQGNHMQVTDKTISTTKKAYHAATFELNGTTYFGMEDWTNTSQSDMDLNDFMCIFDGALPIPVDEEETTTSSWILACEDLGSTNDIDFNDVVLQVSHVSGRNTATITPLAAGGNLATDIWVGVPYEEGSIRVGEVHHLFGDGDAQTGEYSFHNTYSRGSAGRGTTINVDKNFSMASSVVGTYDDASTVNMAGIHLMTDQSDGRGSGSSNAGAIVISAPTTGAVPQMICLPAKYVKATGNIVGGKPEYEIGDWAWPRERIEIGTAYPKFREWVGNSNNTDWYNYASGAVITGRSETTTDNPNDTPPVDANKEDITTFSLTNVGSGSVTLSTGALFTVEYDGVPNDYEGTITITSSNAGAVSTNVNGNPMIIGAQVETQQDVTITVTLSGDAKYNGTSKTFLVKVVAYGTEVTRKSSDKFGDQCCYFIPKEDLKASTPVTITVESLGSAFSGYCCSSSTWYGVNDCKFSGEANSVKEIVIPAVVVNKCIEDGSLVIGFYDSNEKLGTEQGINVKVYFK